jgi:hypothetical protein
MMHGLWNEFMTSFNIPQNNRNNNNSNRNTNTTNASGPCPPASNKVINSLSLSQVTADDLVDDSNKECAVCLDEHNISDMACKLYCGHLYHMSCIKDWLKKQATCPVCRYELETDDPSYELNRRKRMQKRKIRCRKDELSDKSIRELKELLDFFDEDYSLCFDKRDLVDKLVSSGNVVLIEGVGAIEMTMEELHDMPSSHLIKMIKSFGIAVPNALEKRDLIDCLIASERVNVIVRSNHTTQNSHTNSYDNSNNNNSYHTNNNLNDGTKKAATSSESTSNEYKSNPILAEPKTNVSDARGDMKSNYAESNHPQSKSSNDGIDVSGMTTKELISVCKALGVNTSGCLEREDIASRLCSHLRESHI